jgi:hypothetical protein
MGEELMAHLKKENKRKILLLISKINKLTQKKLYCSVRGQAIIMN